MDLDEEEIRRQFFVNVKNRIRIVDLISEYTDLLCTGQSYEGTCPISNDCPGPFVVVTKPDQFKCGGCGNGGDAFSFIERMKNIKFSSALRYLSEKYEIQVPDGVDI